MNRPLLRPIFLLLVALLLHTSERSVLDAATIVTEPGQPVLVSDDIQEDRQSNTDRNALAAAQSAATSTSGVTPSTS